VRTLNPNRRATKAALSWASLAQCSATARKAALDGMVSPNAGTAQLRNASTMSTASACST